MKEIEKYKAFDIGDFEDPPYFKCVLFKHPELLKTGPQKKFFRRVKGRPDTFGMAKGPVFECLECGCKYIYSVREEGAGVMYTPIGQHERPKWMDDMPEGQPICGGASDQWSLVWKKGEDPHWDVTATMYITWAGGKLKEPGEK
jgi:hypothetical protein